MIRALTRKGVFLCRCRILDGVLKVGLLLLEQPMSGEVVLFDVDNHAHQIRVALPPEGVIAMTDVELEIIS